MWRNSSKKSVLRKINKFSKIMLLKRKIEILIVSIYTILTLKIVYPFLFYVIPNTWGEFLDILDTFVVLNNNLMALSIGIFLNVALILYFRIFIKKKYEAVALVIYTLINLELLSMPFLHFHTSYGGKMIYDQYVPGFNLLAVFIGLFLNVALVIYWMQKDTI